MKAVVAQSGKGFSAKTKPAKKKTKKAAGTKLQTLTQTVQTVAPDAIAKLAPKLVGAHHQTLQTAQGWQTVDKGAVSSLLDHSLHSIWPPAIASSPDHSANGINGASVAAHAGSNGDIPSLSAEDQAALGELADLMQQWEMLDGKAGAGPGAPSAQEVAAEAASEAAAALASQRWAAAEAPKDFKTAASQLLGLAGALPNSVSAAAALPAAAAAAVPQHVQAEAAEAVTEAVASVAAAAPAELKVAEAVPTAASAAAGPAAAAAPAATPPELRHADNGAAIATAAPETSIKPAPATKTPAVKKATRVSAKAKAAAAAAGMRAAAPQGPVCSETISEARHELAGVEQQMGRLAELLAEAHSTLHMVRQDMAVQHAMTTSTGAASGAQDGGAVLPGSGAHAQAMTAAAEGAVAKVEVAAWGELVMLMADVMLDVQGELGALQQVVQENNVRLEVAAGVARQHEAAAAEPAERDAALSLAVVGVQACLERLQELRRV